MPSPETRALQGVKIGEEMDEDGNPMSTHICFGCGAVFTLTPPSNAGVEWGGCLAKECVTYDHGRDLDRFFSGEDDG